MWHKQRSALPSTRRLHQTNGETIDAENNNEPQRPNYFVGFPLPDFWVENALLGLPPGLRTFRGEDIHITVAFLGACSDEQAHAAWLATIGIDGDSPLADEHPFEVELGRIETFGNPAQPSSLSAVPVDADGPATTFLARHRDRIFHAAGRPPDARPPRPHSTIVRIPRKAPPELRAAAIAWAEQVPPLRIVVPINEIALFTWTDHREIQLYHIIARRPLDRA